MDLAYLAVEAPDTTLNIGAVVIFERGPGLADVRRQVARRLGAVPRFRQILHHPGPLAGRLLWTDDPGFRLEQHIDEVPGQPAGDEDSLLRLALDLLGPALDRRHPLWRIWFVDNALPGRSALILLLHHVLADGAAALAILGTLVADADAPLPPPQDPPSWFDLVRDHVRSRIATLRGLGRRRPPASPDATPFLRRLLDQLRRSSPTSLNAPIGPRRRLALLRLNVAAVHRAAHAQAATINDAVLALAAGGVRALLAARGEPVHRMRLYSAVAVSLRQPGSCAPPGNQTGTILVRLPCEEADPRVRIGLIHDEVVRARHRQPSTAPSFVMLGLARLRLLRWFTRHQRMTNVVESDVVGPRTGMYLCGSPVLDIVPIGNLAGNLGLAVLAVSYVDTLAVTVQVDADRFPDLPVLMTAMTRDWEALAELPTRS